jgi:hypothetical protein
MMCLPVGDRETHSKTSSVYSALRLPLMTVATAAVGFGLVCVLVNVISGYEFGWHYPTLATTAFGMAALGAYVALDRGAWRWLMIATLGISVGGICVGLLDIVTGKLDVCRPTMFRLSYVLFPTVIMSAWFGLLSLARLTGWQGWLRLMVQFCVLLLILLPVAVWWLDVTNQFYLDAAIVLFLSGLLLGSLAVLGTITVGVMSLLERGRRTRLEEKPSDDDANVR